MKKSNNVSSRIIAYIVPSMEWYSVENDCVLERFPDIETDTWQDNLITNILLKM